MRPGASPGRTTDLPHTTLGSTTLRPGTDHQSTPHRPWMDSESARGGPRIHPTTPLDRPQCGPGRTTDQARARARALRAPRSPAACPAYRRRGARPGGVRARGRRPAIAVNNSPNARAMSFVSKPPSHLVDAQDSALKRWTGHRCAAGNPCRNRGHESISTDPAWQDMLCSGSFPHKSFYVLTNMRRSSSRRVTRALLGRRWGAGRARHRRRICAARKPCGRLRSPRAPGKACLDARPTTPFAPSVQLASAMQIRCSSKPRPSG